jgi:flagellar biogenesis protein FliO
MPNAQGMLLRLGLCTALVLALCLATLWLLGRRFSHRISKKYTGGRLRVMATVPLANRSALHLLSIEKQRLIAAVDAAGLKALVLVPQDYEAVLEEAVVQRYPGDWQI